MAFKIGSNIAIDNTGGINSTQFREGQYANTKFASSDIGASHNFGVSVAVGDGKIVVGARGISSGTGAAYIFDLDGNQLSKITASDGSSNDWFGTAVGIGSGRIVVGASQYFAGAVGAAYIFDLDGNQLSKITASDGASGDYFGQSIAIGCNRIAVGAYKEDNVATDAGSVYLYSLDGTQLKKITAPNAGYQDNFGGAVAIGCGRIVVGATLEDDPTSSGSVYVYNLNGDFLYQIPGDTSSAFFGASVAVGDGRIVAGHSTDNGIKIYNLDGDLVSSISGTEFYGATFNVAISSGKIFVNDSYAAGSNPIPFQVYDLDGNKITSLGSDIDYSTEGNIGQLAAGCNRLVIGDLNDSENGSGSGAAYIIDIDETINTHWEDHLSGFGIKD